MHVSKAGSIKARKGWKLPLSGWSLWSIGDLEPKRLPCNFCGHLVRFHYVIRMGNEHYRCVGSDCALILCDDLKEMIDDKNRARVQKFLHSTKWSNGINLSSLRLVHGFGVGFNSTENGIKISISGTMGNRVFKSPAMAAIWLANWIESTEGINYFAARQNTFGAIESYPKWRQALSRKGVKREPSKT